MNADMSVIVELSHFSNLLRFHRTRSGLTQRELADFSTISERAIRDLENGRVRQPRRDTVRLIADALRLGPRARTELLMAADGSRPGWPLAAGFENEPPGPPAAPRPLIAREAPAAVLTAELADGAEQVVGIVGLGGVGKTRLAVEIASRLHRAGGFPVLWFAFDAAGYEYRRPSGPDGLPEVVRSCVEDLFGADRSAAGAPRGDFGSLDRRRHDPDVLAALVGSRPALLVIDGAPRPVRAERVARLLRHCPGLRILTTSLRPCGLPGERIHTLHPLEIPRPGQERDPESLARVPAVRVFLAEAARSRPGYALTAADAEHVAEICRLVDGLPAALQAAASWLVVHDPATLRRSLAESAGLLGHLAGAGTATPSRVGVERRVGALSGEQSRVLEELCAAEGDFDLTEAAGLTGLAVAHCGRVLRDLLGSGLVCPAAGRPGADNRFRVLNLARAARRTGAPVPALAG